MTQVFQLNRRLLLAILRAPAPNVSTYLVQRSVRAIHTSSRWLDQAPSVSFGAETDQLLETYNTKSKRGTKAKSKGKKNVKIAREAAGNAATREQHDAKVEKNSHSSEGDDISPEVVISSAPDSASPESKIPVRPRPRHRGQTSGMDLDEVTDAVYKSRKAIAASRSSSIVEKRVRKTEPTHPPKNSWSKSQSAAQTPHAGSRGKQTVTFGPRRKSEPWQVQKDALKRKFGDQGWQPRKLVSPDAMDGIRSLHEQDPEKYSTPVLADRFKLSPDAVRRILKSKWRPSEEEMQVRRERWARRHDRIWDHMAALGLRPERTKNKEVEGPEAFEEEVRAKQALGQL